MLDAGLVLFVGLVVLLVWRFCCPWRLGGKWMEHANYCSLLYLLLAFLLVYSVYLFLWAALHASGKASWSRLPAWLRPGMVMCPGVVTLTYLICCYQSWQHVDSIRRGAAADQHDRVVQIIALPAVYSIMAMNSLTRVYQFFTATGFGDTSANALAVADQHHLALSMSETCFWVGDLFESWALYQFGKLTLELIHAAIIKQEKSDVESDRAAASALLLSHGAVEALAWLGILLFMAVNFVQAGWSLYLLTFGNVSWEDYDTSVAQFGAAGLVASCAAIWNVGVVEYTFHGYLTDYSPFLKFLSVKILVTFAWFQRGSFSVLKIVNASLPVAFLHKIPFIGTVMDMDEIEFELFYATMLIFECFLLALAHGWAWKASEPWYEQPELNPFADDVDEEKMPLVKAGK